MYKEIYGISRHKSDLCRRKKLGITAGKRYYLGGIKLKVLVAGGAEFIGSPAHSAGWKAVYTSDEAVALTVEKVL